jgi:hypothetical protein
MTSHHPLDESAAALTAALHDAAGDRTPLPAALAARIVADGRAQLRDQVHQTPSTSSPLVVVRPTRTLRFMAAAGWLAAAASLALWASAPRDSAPTTIARVADVPSLDAVRLALLSDSTSIQRAWQESTDPAARGASGEIVWNDAQQRGVMRFVGLTPNDPRLAQYQLWIIDAERDARYPVDGGVFDVGSNGEVLVAVTARVPVGRPTLFAVTLERPGGVVVSTRERLVLAAAVDG